MITPIVALFVAYAAAVTWQTRRALRTRDARERLRQARLLLLTVSVGVPLLAALILALP